MVLNRPKLGVNFCHDARQPIGFNADAVRALRPPIVRAVTSHAENIHRWFESARAERLRVLWTIPIETIGFRRAMYIAREIGSQNVGPHAAFTAGVEIGFAPWALRSRNDGAAAAEYLHQAIEIASLLEGRTSVLLGLGQDCSREARAWAASVFAEASRLPNGELARHFTALSASATAIGRPIARVRFTDFAAEIHGRFGLRLAFTRVGWHVGQPLTFWRSIVENVRAATEAIGTPHEHVTHVTQAIRARWLLEANAFAEQLGATHFIVEAERPAPSLGVNRWSLYNPETGRPDQVWTALQWRHAMAAQLNPRAFVHDLFRTNDGNPVELEDYQVEIMESIAHGRTSPSDRGTASARRRRTRSASFTTC
jgi:hypothetical protein